MEQFSRVSIKAQLDECPLYTATKVWITRMRPARFNGPLFAL